MDDLETPALQGWRLRITIFADEAWSLPALRELTHPGDSITISHKRSGRILEWDGRFVTLDTSKPSFGSMPLPGQPFRVQAKSYIISGTVISVREYRDTEAR